MLLNAREIRRVSGARKFVHKYLQWIPVLRFQSSEVPLDGVLQLRPCGRVSGLFTHPVQHFDQTRFIDNIETSIEPMYMKFFTCKSLLNQKIVAFASHKSPYTLQRGV